MRVLRKINDSDPIDWIEVETLSAGKGRAWRAGTGVRGSHNMIFDTGAEQIDSSVFAGAYGQTGAGGAAGIGYGFSYTNFGKGNVTAFNYGPSGGLGSSIGLLRGTARVVSEETEPCDFCR